MQDPRNIPKLPKPDPDEMIGLVLDGEASDAEWETFTAVADASPELWKRFANFARVHAMLGRALGDIDASLNDVSLHSAQNVPSSPQATSAGTYSFASAAARAVRGSGWLAAACVGLVWAVTHIASSHGHIGPYIAGNGEGGGPQYNGLLVSTAADALDAYRTLAGRDGVDVDESPEQIVIQVLPALDGQSVEVVAVRQLVERRIIDGLYRIAADDGGTPVLMPLHVAFEDVWIDEQTPPLSSSSPPATDVPGDL